MTQIGNVSSFVSRLHEHPVLIAMLHAPPLPGSARSALAIEEVVERVVADARSAASGGVDALLLENYGDAPFAPGTVPPHVVSLLTLLALRIREAVDLPLGVNVLRNDARAALAVALAAAGDFVRVNVLAGVVATDQGLLSGRADRVLDYRRSLGAGIPVIADVDVKHGRPLWGAAIDDRARELAERAGADALIVTGPATGRPPAPTDLDAVRAVSPVPVLVGSGVTEESAAELLASADGAIVGTALKVGGEVGAPIDPGRVRAIVAQARAAWRGRR
jgi:membrane complex biogenesis BtpA family protein